MSSIFERVQKDVAKQFSVAVERITLETDIFTDLLADSLDSVEMSMELEDEFDIVIKEEEWDDVSTVRQMVALIEEKIK